MGPHRESNPGPLAPEARIIALDHEAAANTHRLLHFWPPKSALITPLITRKQIYGRPTCRMINKIPQSSIKTRISAIFKYKLSKLLVCSLFIVLGKLQRSVTVCLLNNGTTIDLYSSVVCSRKERKARKTKNENQVLRSEIFDIMWC